MKILDLFSDRKQSAPRQEEPAAPKISPPISPERPAGEIEARQVLPPPFESSNPHYSLVYPALDDPARPSKRLIELSLAAAGHAGSVDLSSILSRMPSPPYWPDVWPGEHYKLLAGLIKELAPRQVIEIGTSTGLSALTIKQFLSEDANVTTYDILPWQEFDATVLKAEDFDSRLTQLICDLSDPSVFDQHRDLLKKADFVFIDAAKDSTQEDLFLANFDTLEFDNDPIFMFDDVRLWNMLRTWREIKRPKLDVTSFGHWSGTGLVDWKGQVNQ